MATKKDFKIKHGLTVENGSLVFGEDAYSTSTSYVGLKTSYMSGVNDYMIISGKSSGHTYISAKDGNDVLIRGGGNLGSNQIKVPDSNYIEITTTEFRVSGKAGISNTSPSSQYFNTLVVGNTSGENGITIQSSATTRGVLAFSDTDSATSGRYDGYIDYSHNSTYMSFHVNTGNEQMRIDSSGNLLVGKTNTTFGNAGIEARENGNFRAIRDGANVADFNRLTSDGNIVAFYKSSTNVGSIGSDSGTLYIDGGSGSTGLYFGSSNIYPRDGGAAVNNAVDIGHGSYKFKDLYLAGNAQIGSEINFTAQAVDSQIKTTTSYLEIIGNTTDTADGARMWIGNGQTDQGWYVNAANFFFRNLSGTAVVYINSGTGNLGIGTTTPNAKIHVSSGSNEAARFESTDAGSYISIKDSASTSFNFIEGGGDILALGTNNAEKMRIMSGGNVGINNTNPQQKLDVEGEVRADRFRVDGTGAILKKQNDSWTSGNQIHDVLYNGWRSSTGDYVYLKASGNSTADHGIIQVADNGTFIGQTDLEQGALADSNTDPIDTVFAFFRNDKSYVKGLLGVGTNNPGYKLEVTSSDGDALARFKDSDSSYDGIRIGGDTNGGYIGNATGFTKEAIYLQNSINAIRVYTNGSERMRITSAGNVGIGTNSPYSSLDVVSDSSGHGIRNRGRASDNIGQIDLTNNASTVVRSQIQHGETFLKIKTISNIPLSFHTNNTERMTILNGGNVGINETSADCKLHVKEDTKDNIVLKLENYLATVNGAAYENYQELSFAAGGSGPYSGIRQYANGWANSDTALAFWTQQHGGSYAERMRIDGDGNVGIGISSPPDILTITGDAKYIAHYDGARYAFKLGADSSGDGNFMLHDGVAGAVKVKLYAEAGAANYINNGGNFGIGTTSPAHKLYIDSGATNVAAGLKSSDAGSYIGFEDDTTGNTGSNSNVFVGANGNNFVIFTGATEKARVDSSGNIGVGTTSPNAKLHVSDATAPTFRLSRTGTGQIWQQSIDSSGRFLLQEAASEGGTKYTRLTVDDTGQVGIGRSDPTYNLDVKGPGATIARFIADTSGEDALVRIIAANYNTEADARLFLGEGDTYGMTVEYDGLANIGYLGMNNNVDPTGAYSKRIQMSRGGTEVAFMAGDVGIGTASPSFGAGSGLEIERNGTATIRLQNTSGKSVEIKQQQDFVIEAMNSGQDIILMPTANVGVGTASPSSKLTVEGDIKQTTGDLLYSGGGNWDIKHTVDDQNIVFSTSQSGSTTEKVRIRYDGRVGIGTSSPGYLLDVLSTGNDSVIRARTPTANAGAYFHAVSGTNGFYGLSLFHQGTEKFFIGGYGAERLGFWVGAKTTASNEKMSLDTSGRLGIGTTSPDNQLMVQGPSSTGSGSTGNVALFEGPSGTNGLKVFVDDTENAAGLQTIATDDLLLNPFGGLVGIGTTSPAYDLHVPATIGARILKLGHGVSYARISTDDATKPLDLQINDSTKLRIATDGKVGIGTTSPATKLHIQDATNPVLRVEDSTNSVKTDIGATDTEGYIGTQTAHPFKIRYENVPSLRFESFKQIYHGADNTYAENLWIGGNVERYQYLDTRDYMRPKGHHAASEHIIFEAGKDIRVVPYLDDTNIYLNGVLKHSNTTAFEEVVISSADTSLYDRVSADKPIIVTTGQPRQAGSPISFGGHMLAGFTTRYYPIKFRLFSPYSKVDVEVYKSSTSTVDISGTPSYTGTINQNGGLEITESGASGTNYWIIKATGYIIGAQFPTGGDQIIMPPIGQEVLSNAQATSVIKINDGTNTSQTTGTNNNGAYYYRENSGDRELGIGAFGTADGAGGDAEYAVPLEFLSDYYIYPEDDITNFRLASYTANKIQVLDKSGNRLYAFDHSTATKRLPAFNEEGDASGNGSALNSNGPFRFIGTAPFHLVCQSTSDYECVQLGAMKDEIGKVQSFTGGHIPNSLTIGTLTSGQTGNVVINNEGGNTATLEVLSRTNRSVLKIADNDTIGYMSAEDGILSIGRSSGLSANNINIDSSHRVGIGTGSPVRPLHVATSTGGSIIHLTDDSTGHTATDGVDIQQEGTLFQILNREAGDIRFGTSGAERMRIDSSGNVLVGTTSSANSSAGFRAYNGGNGAFTIAGGTTLTLNRLSNDGEILQLQKDTTMVGSIGTFSQDSQSNFYIGFNNASEDVGLGFGHASGTGRAYYPCRDGGSGVSAAIDIGTSTYKYKDLHLSGNVNAGGQISALGGNLTIKEFTGSSNYTQIKKTNTGSNLALVSQESIYMMLDANNDQTNRSFQIVKDSDAPGSGTTVFSVLESGATTISGALEAASLTVSTGGSINFEAISGDVIKWDGTYLNIGAAEADDHTTRLRGFGGNTEIILAETLISVEGNTRITKNKTATSTPILEIKDDSSTDVGGEYIALLYDGSTTDQVGGVIGMQQPVTNAPELFIANGDSTSSIGLAFWGYIGTAQIVPCGGTGVDRDNAIDLGSSSSRFDDIYATNGTIQTSDRNDKTDFEDLSAAERRVGLRCKDLIKRFRWNSAKEEKGDDARYHFGIIAQDVQDAFTQEGLDAGDYGIFISKTWWEATVDGEVRTYETEELAPQGAVEKTRLGVRYNELLSLIIAVI